MKIIINLFFIIVIIYNLNKRRQNLFHSYIPITTKISTILLLFIAIFIWYKYDYTILGFILALLSVIFFISFFLSVGISENLFFVFMPNSIVIKEIPFNEVKEIVIKDDKHDFNLFIRAYGDEFFQKYDISKKEEIISSLESRIFDKSIIKK